MPASPRTAPTKTPTTRRSASARAAGSCWPVTDVSDFTCMAHPGLLASSLHFGRMRTGRKSSSAEGRQRSVNRLDIRGLTCSNGCIIRLGRTTSALRGNGDRTGDRRHDPPSLADRSATRAQMITVCPHQGFGTCDRRQRRRREPSARNWPTAASASACRRTSSSISRASPTPRREPPRAGVGPLARPLRGRGSRPHCPLRKVVTVGWGRRDRWRSAPRRPGPRWRRAGGPARRAARARRPPGPGAAPRPPWWLPWRAAPPKPPARP